LVALRTFERSKCRRAFGSHIYRLRPTTDKCLASCRTSPTATGL